METDATPTLPMLAADLPAATGMLKIEPEDFRVEEIPASVPQGDGEHLYLWIEKRDISHERLLTLVSRALHVPSREIGSAGMKDRRAVTRQWLSVPARAAANLDGLQGDGLRVLETALHSCKLRPGHLQGNRFEVRVRWPAAADEHVCIERVQARLRRLAEQGLANYYGAQRFGRAGDNAVQGLRLLRGDDALRDVHPRRRRFVRKLVLSAAQSLLFNRVLAARIEDGLLHRVIEGDVLARSDSGGLFRATDVAHEQSRLNERTVVVAGPMFGPKMMRAAGPALARERDILAAEELTLAVFEPFLKLAAGTRRAMVVWPGDIDCEPEPGAVVLRFVLPAGVYATVLLEEAVGDLTLPARVSAKEEPSPEAGLRVTRPPP